MRSICWPRLAEQIDQRGRDRDLTRSIFTRRMVPTSCRSAVRLRRFLVHSQPPQCLRHECTIGKLITQEWVLPDHARRPDDKRHAASFIDCRLDLFSTVEGLAGKTEKLDPSGVRDSRA